MVMFFFLLCFSGQTPGPKGFDINVAPVWKKNISGRGVVVTILDDGIEYTHPDLKKNYYAKASYDFNSHDDDPFPKYTRDNINKHGTRLVVWGRFQILSRKMMMIIFNNNNNNNNNNKDDVKNSYHNHYDSGNHSVQIN